MLLLKALPLQITQLSIISAKYGFITRQRGGGGGGAAAAGSPGFERLVRVSTAGSRQRSQRESSLHEPNTRRLQVLVEARLSPAAGGPPPDTGKGASLEPSVQASSGGRKRLLAMGKYATVNSLFSKSCNTNRFKLISRTSSQRLQLK